jgi:hypothetical protein
LVEQLTPRRAEIRQVAFGHAGPLDGLDALIAWAEGK